MYYKYRKQIYTALIVIVLIGDFLIGKSMGTGAKKETVKNTSVSATVEEKNLNYGQAININGVNYSSTVTIENASIEGTDTLKVNVTESQNTGVAGYKLVAYGDSNNVLNSQQTSFDQNANSYGYSITFDNQKDKKVKIMVYPLTNDMKNNTNLSLDNAAFGEAVLNLNLIKQDTINAIKGTGGVSSGQ